MEKHSIIDNKVHVYKRDNSRYWQCSTYMNGRNHRVSTQEENLRLAKEFGKEWYIAVYSQFKRHAQYSRIEKLVYGVRDGENTITMPSPYTKAQLSDAPPAKKKKTGKTFAEAAIKFIGEYEVSVAGQRNERYAKSHESRINKHLIPFFGDTPLNEITAGLVQEYRIQRT